MSRNFELLQKLGKEQEVVAPSLNEISAAPSAASAAAAAPALAVEGPELDEIQGLIQQVFLSPGTTAPRVVVFASPEPGAGCTWVCSHAADTLAARIAGSVCLVDANFSNPSLHSQFGIENHRGLSEALLQADPIRSFTRQLGLPNFWVVSAGTAREEAQGLLASDRMRLRIAELKAEFDFVLIDAPALSTSTDATSIGSLADGVVLVVRANTSRKQTARQAVEQLQASKANVLGAVLNRRTFPIPEGIYKRL